MPKKLNVLTVVMVIFSLCILCSTAYGQNSITPTTPGDEVPSDASEAVDRVERRVALVKSKLVSRHERLQALQALFQAKETLSEQEQIGLLRTTKAIAEDMQEDTRLRANAIWALSGMGMLLKHKKTWTQEDISQECQFLLQTASDESENVQVRRISIAALGDLKMKEAIPLLKVILTDNTNFERTALSKDDTDPNSPVLRSASIALAELAPEEAVEPVGRILAETNDPSVFGSAAYALGQTKSRETIQILVQNRLRLKDNLSVDNAIEASSETVIEILKQPADPYIVSAIQATRSLWREEQKEIYTPLLMNIVADAGHSVDVRRNALKRLMEDADVLPLDARKKKISALLLLVKGENGFSDEIARMRLILNAQILPITHIEGQNEEGVGQ